MYLGFSVGGSRSSRNYFSYVRTKAVASDSRKKAVCNAVNGGSGVAAKRSFSRRFAWSRKHKFLYLRKFDRPGLSRWCFWRRPCAIWTISGSRHQPRSRRRSVSCNLLNVNKHKLQNFDRPLGLSDHLQWSFWCRQHVISSKYDGASVWQLSLP